MRTSLRYPRLWAAGFLHLLGPARGLCCFFVGLLLLGSLQAQGQATSFTCTGAAQTYTVPAGITSLSVEVRGAQGGNGFAQGGNGAIVTSVLAVTPGAVLNLYVGCQTSGLTGGFNGGGTVTADANSAGGGGASDIRMGGTALSNRVIVAAGGGGGGGGVGGGGGGHTGSGGDGAGFQANPGGASGATQSAGGAGGIFPGGTSGENGSLGQGGTASATNSGGAGVGGGGGGYYGGGGGGSCCGNGGGGGGGSSFISSSSAITNGTSTPGGNTGSGSIVITVPLVISPVPGCNTFQSRIITNDQSTKVNDVFAAGTTVYVATGGGLRISTDGGKTFVAQSVLNGQSLEKIFVQGNTIYATNTGSSAIGSTKGLFLIDGQTVTNVSSGNLAPNNVFAVGNTIYVSRVGNANAFGISSDNGGSFTYYPIAPAAESLSGRCVYAIGSKIFVGSTAGTTSGLYVSTNNGVSFSKISTTNGEGRAIYGVGNTVYFASSAGLFVSTDAGVTFTKRTTTDGLGSNAVNDVFADGTTVYAATDNGLAISTNGGQNYTNYTTANGLGDAKVNAVYSVSTTVYAGTDGGLSVSDFAVHTVTPEGNKLTKSAISALPGTSLTLRAADTNTGYRWSPGNATTKDLVVTTSGTYSVTATGDCPGSATIAVTYLTPRPLPPGSVTISGSRATLNFSALEPKSSVKYLSPLYTEVSYTNAPIVRATGPSGYNYYGRIINAKPGTLVPNEGGYYVVLPTLTRRGTYTINLYAFPLEDEELLDVITFIF